MSEIDSQQIRPWDRWSRFIEFGVDNEIAVALIERRVVRQRTIAQKIGTILDGVSPEAVTMPEIRDELMELVGPNRRLIERIFNQYRFS